MSPETRRFGERLVELMGRSLGRDGTAGLVRLCEQYEAELTARSSAEVAHYKAHAERVEESARRSIAQILAEQGRASLGAKPPETP